MLMMSLKQYSESRNVSAKMLRRLAKSGTIAAAIVGNKYLLDVERVDGYFKQLLAPKPVKKAVISPENRQRNLSVHEYYLKRRKELLEGLI